MGKSLSKSDLCWVIVRVFGVVFLYQGIATLLETLMAFSAASGMSKQAGTAAFTMMMRGAPSEVPRFLLGVYLLCAGGLVHWLLMYVSPESQSAESEEVNPKIDSAEQ